MLKLSDLSGRALYLDVDAVMYVLEEIPDSGVWTVALRNGEKFSLGTVEAKKITNVLLLDDDEVEPPTEEYCDADD